MKFFEKNVIANRESSTTTLPLSSLKDSTNNNFYFYSKNDYITILLDSSESWLTAEKKMSLYDMEDFVYDLYLKDS
jgi:hypothetical protein